VRNQNAPVTRPTALLPETLRVVELGEAIPTALAGQYLVKLGADVTRILPADAASVLDTLEPRVGEGDDSRSAAAEWLRRGKSLTTVDLTDPSGLAGVEALIAEADVVLLWGTEAEWSARGLAPDRVAELAPSAVVGRVTPWGDGGPYTGFPDTELAFQATSGFMKLVGVLDREPVRLGGHALQGAAGLLALDGVMIGLFRRENTGQGARFTTSELEAAAHVEWKIATFVQAGMRRELRGEDGGGPAAVRCRDGFFGMFFMPRHWPDVKAIIGAPGLEDERFATPEGRHEHLAELVAIVEESTRTRSKLDLYQEFQAKDIPAGYVATLSDLRTSPQYVERRFFEPVSIDGVGTGELPAAPWQVLTPEDVSGEGAVA
jgi:crotonobetainyl-CoA:carnitine CoA-transferase CaiB-like acyl-CoA transferase